MDEKTFVCTTDEDTRQKLLAEGLKEIKNSNGVYTFLVEGKKNFSVCNDKVTFSNNLCI